jgi:hypothetical protein
MPAASASPSGTSSTPESKKPPVAAAAIGSCTACAKPIDASVGTSSATRVGTSTSGPPVPVNVDTSPVTPPTAARIGADGIRSASGCSRLPPSAWSPEPRASRPIAI